MSEVKRFEMEKEYSLDINIVPTEYPDGSFVHYDDYAAIQEQLAQRDAQIAALTAENVALKSSIPDERFIDVMNENMDDVSLAEDVGFNRAVRKMITASAETPATDAAANALRAEGVNHAGKMVMAMLNHQDKGVARALEVMAQVEMNYIKPEGGSVAE